MTKTLAGAGLLGGFGGEDGADDALDDAAGGAADDAPVVEVGAVDLLPASGASNVVFCEETDDAGVPAAAALSSPSLNICFG